MTNKFAAEFYLWSMVEYQLADVSINLPSLGRLVGVARARWREYTARRSHTGDRMRMHIIDSAEEARN